MRSQSDSGKKVLYVVNDLVYFRAHREALTDAVSDLGHSVFVIAGNCTAGDARETDRFTLIPLDIARQNLDLAADFQLARTVRQWVRDQAPDLVHMITIKPALFGTLGLVLPTALTGFQLVWTMPGLGKIYEAGNSPVHRLRRWLTTCGLAFAAGRGNVRITVENEGDRQRLIDYGVTVAGRIEVIDGTGLDLAHFSPPPKSKQGPLTFLMATRLLKAKGVGTYIAAARRLRERADDARFLLAGLSDPINPDAYDESLIETAANDGLIEWLGAVDQSQMPDVLREADVFCLPTRLQEGLPRSLMEAAACGCALIAPDQLPVRKVLEDGKTGWLLEWPRESNLVEAFSEAMNDPAATRVRGVAAAAHIRSLPVGNADVLERFFTLYGLDETPE